MAEVVKPGASAVPEHPLETISALRPTRPKRVPTRVSIVVPKASTSTSTASTDINIKPTTTTNSASSNSPHLSIKSPWSKQLILTLDGGGIRGYSSLIILRALMNQIAETEQNLEPLAISSAYTCRIDPKSIPENVLRKGQYLPCHYFDYVAGTSVGGLIAIMLGMQGKSVADCINAFQRENKAIPLTNDLPTVEFPLLRRPTTWPTKRTRSFFDTFNKFSVTATGKSFANSSSHTPGSGVALAQGGLHPDAIEFRKDTLQCQTLAWCTEIEDDSKRERRPYAFCTYKEEDELPSPSSASAGSSSRKLVSIPEVAKAITTPSSSSFKPFKLGSGQFVDGSKLIRDPTLEVLKEITALLSGPGEPPIDLVLSLGTDEHQAWFYEKLRRPKPEAASSRPSSREELDREEGKSYMHYHRFEMKDIRLGFRSKYFLKEIEEATEKWLATDTQQKHIHQYAEMLVERRRARASTARWETFALGVRYYCFHDECKSVDRVFGSRGDFYEHLDRKHRLMREAAKNMLDTEKELDKGRRFGVA
ncbi:patatin-like phospholipase-domain-containing protein [Lasiosphaeris hirsuta]|uniref:Patatin-like phospholipase-domain-containing protein n=1 Tax=Lasiosphaeris hirsuta TaxID=260670 RepID=A0AA40A2R2_9PEZI|nr:patatin-like phospholipase-domain-containing protein [Lasiosphaeris hirsuta]